MTKTGLGKRLLLFLGLVAIGMAGLAVKRQWRAEALPTPVDEGLTRLAPPLALHAFRLHATTGKPFTPAALRGHWSLLFFGYTHCPDVCPATLKVLQAVKAQLRARGLPAQGIFVTVDPARDDPDTLARYLAWFDDDFLGVTGETAELAALRRQLGVYVEETDSRTAAGYVLAHTDRLYLIDPQGRVVALFSERADSRRLARQIAAVMESEGEG